MADTGPAWDLYRAFLAVLEAGSLSGAARALGVAQPTVGRHIEALESALGGALFTRSSGGLRPTEAALSLAPHAQAMSAAAETLIRTASGEADAVRGAVRVTASDIVGAEVLPAILTDFRERHGEVTIELALSNRQEDLLRRDADIAVRMARPTQGALFARRVGSIHLNFYAHHRYLQKHGEPRTLDDLAAHALIGYDRLAPPQEALKAVGFEVSRDLFALRTDSDLAQLAALRAGFGICACQPAIARRDPNLVPILVDAFGFDLEAWVVMHEDLKASRRMRLMFDHLAAGLKAYVAAR
ncbi:MAG: LysR family transcriptional regulator [Pseudomonadota bacterium]|nr:LysR family transcriptional regulator [Pseudomonadota bacterium]